VHKDRVKYVAFSADEKYILTSLHHA